MQVSKDSTLFFLVAQAIEKYGGGSGPIFLDNVECNGIQTRLSECPHRGIGDSNCRHFEDAGVRCLAGNVFMFEIL